MLVETGVVDDPSAFADDSYRAAVVTLQITVDIIDFMGVIQKIENQSANPFNLDSFNCTTHSGNFLFWGENAGDLGGDIRALDLTLFLRQNGNRQVVRVGRTINHFMPRQGKALAIRKNI